MVNGLMYTAMYLALILLYICFMGLTCKPAVLKRAILAESWLNESRPRKSEQQRAGRNNPCACTQNTRTSSAS